MTKQIICSSCGKLKPHCAKGLCHNCYSVLREKTERDKNPYKYDGEQFAQRTCKVLKDHANDPVLKNDSNKLTTDFIVNQIEKLRESKK